MLDYRQIKQLKSQNKDRLLFVRVGDFYEVFDQDAHIVSKEFDLILTERSMSNTVERIPMAGVPYHSFDQYVAKLVEKGHAVAIADTAIDVQIVKKESKDNIIKENKIMENTAINTENTTLPPEVSAISTPQEYVELADKTFFQFMKEGKYKEVVETMADFGYYSLNNQVLIKQQHPTATKVSSEKSWNYHNRFAKEDTAPIKILAPIYEKVVSFKDGLITEKNEIKNFKLNEVYDISQTEGKKMKLDSSIDIDKNFDALALALQNTLKSYEFGLADIEDNGILDLTKHTVTIKNGLSKKETLNALINQVSAVLVYERSTKSQGLKNDTIPNITAIEITAVAAIVSKHLGLEPAQDIITPEFEKLSDEQIGKFYHNMNTMRSVSQIMVLAVDNTMSDILTKEKIAEAKAQETTEETTKTTTKTHTKTNSKLQAEMA